VWLPGFICKTCWNRDNCHRSTTLVAHTKHFLEKGKKGTTLFVTLQLWLKPSCDYNQAEKQSSICQDQPTALYQSLLWIAKASSLARVLNQKILTKKSIKKMDSCWVSYVEKQNLSYHRQKYYQLNGWTGAVNVQWPYENNKQHASRGYKGLQGWPTARDSGWWQLAGETKSTSVENWN
jgi:hypothetical protein